MRGRSPRLLLVLAALGLIVAAAIVLRLAPRSRTAAVVAPAPPGAADPQPGRTMTYTADANDPPAPLAPALDPLGDADAAARAWASVDLEAVREAMPDSLYWKMGAPTQDPQVLREREEERARWNAEYGKVLSNTATAAEIDAFYAHQQLLSTDYIEFITHVLTHYGDQIPKRDAGLLKLAGEMHLAKLEEIPRKIAEAHERRAEHEAARRAWRAEQEAFARDE